MKPKAIRQAMGENGAAAVAPAREQAILAQLSTEKRKRVEHCIAEVLPILERYRVELHPQVVIQASGVTTQVLFVAKD